jgi:prolipoprotein diacylglyceryltransferase
MALEVGVIAGILGARADYVLSHLNQFTSVGQVLALWQGGLALFGGLIGGVGAGVLMLRRRGSPVMPVLDVAAPSLALAIAIGRVGDLLLTDHLGRPTGNTFALGYLVKAGYRLAPGFGPSPAAAPGAGESCADVGRFYAGCTYHLSAGYDLFGAAALAALLLFLSRRRLPAGMSIAVFGGWYGTQRLLLDFTRSVDERPAAGLTGTQWLAVGLLGASVTAVFVILRRTRARRPLHENTEEAPTASPPEDQEVLPPGELHGS